MIIRFIVNSIKLVVETVAKIVAFLLIELGLWLPAVYSFAFLIICAVTKTKITGSILPIYFVFLGIATLISLYFTISRKSKKKKEGNDSSVVGNNLKKVKYKGKAENGYNPSYAEDNQGFFASQDSYNKTNNGQAINQGGTMQNQYQGQQQMQGYYPPPPAYYYPPPPAYYYPPPNSYYPSYNPNADNKDLEEKYLAKKRPQKQESEDATAEEKLFSKKEVYSKPIKYHDYSNPNGSEELLRTSSYELEQRLEGFSQSEKPLVFTTRKDPNLVIFEYSDRLEIYEQTKKGLSLLTVEYRN